MSNIIKFQLQNQFQRFFYQTFCVFSRIKDIKHIKQEFYSIAWVMPQGWNFWALGCTGGQIFFFEHGHVAYQIDGDDEKNRMQVQFSP